MENLPVQKKFKTLTSALPLDEKLTELLLGADSPVVGPKTARALREFAAQPEPDRVTEPQVETMIGKLAMATAQTKVSEAEAEARVEMYWLALRDLSTIDLRSGFIELLRNSTFLPTPAEVRKAALKCGAVRRYAKSRASYLGS